jgi:DNA-binding NtrC family response regulator
MVKILIMDDEEVVRNAIFDMLKPLGHKVFLADSGVQAIELARREYFDVALLDIKIPDMGGLDVMAELKKINPNVRCIMLSSLSDVQSAVIAIKQGAADYISKPFKEEDVVKVVSGVIQSMFGSNEKFFRL